MQHFIGYRTFAALDSRATEAQESQRENALRLEFMALVPAAGRLRAGELVLQRHHTDEGCRLEYHLVLLPQTGFDFDGSGDPLPPDRKQADDFQRDIDAVAAECQNVKTRLVMAHSPALGLADLQQETQAILDAKALRSLFRRRERHLVFPTPGGNLVLDLPAVASHLPTGIEGEIAARVNKLSVGRKTHLHDLIWKPPPNGREPRSLQLPRSAVARRDLLSNEASVELLTGMDAGELMRFHVRLQFDWATGIATDFNILAVSI